MRFFMLITFLLLASSTAFAQQSDEKKKNKLVESKGFGEWEVWCIDIEQTGRVECNLNQVLLYKDHPDFRAMIVRFYSDGQNMVELKIDYEWQTSFNNGYIQVDQRLPFSLKQCDKPCIIMSTPAKQLSQSFAEGKAAKIRFYDYIVQEFIVDIELDQFVAASEALHSKTKQYR